MLRLSELRLELDHTEDDLEQAVLRCLRVPREQLISHQLVKQSIDARRRDRIRVIYSVDVQVRARKHCCVVVRLTGAFVAVLMSPTDLLPALLPVRLMRQGRGLW